MKSESGLIAFGARQCIRAHNRPIEKQNKRRTNNKCLLFSLRPSGRLSVARLFHSLSLGLFGATFGPTFFSVIFLLYFS